MRFIKKILVSILTLESKAILKKYRPFVIAVTGSVGKTSTKDAIYAMLRNSGGFVRKSEKSLNSDIGLPLTIIGVPNAWYSISLWVQNIIQGLSLILINQEYPNLLILEVGADHPGDIKKITKWLHPDIAVITKISDMPVHVEFFKSPEQVFEEKMALGEALKDGGTLLLFADDNKVASIGNIIKKNSKKKFEVLTFGTAENANIRGFDYEVKGMNEGFTFKMNFSGRIETVKIDRVLGKQQMYPLLAAIAVGKVRGLSVDDMMRGLYEYESPRGRMNVLDGVNGSQIIDDTYNSSPDAVVSALETLKESKCRGRRIAILGDMMELGKYSTEEHRKVGKVVSKISDILITVGPRARMIGEEALANGMEKERIISFDCSIDAIPYVKSLIQTGDVVLIKGSQSPRLERITKALLKNPEKADKLLVRQEKEWLEKK
ncbi:MAG: UDP-N-acetylmuramoyl-tripeptide--D-alanyl-D-alanine ligase [Candidatus Paceibacterota bacterium]|jgi:UDP-N-acetylmuramoyl-tripeptide--D-alanyl-D-alanine ligase